jgi:glycerophosphoryl diester phosphodiesterase
MDLRLSMKSAQQGQIQILAHRGLVSEFVPENTLSAFADALAAGADIIETDIQASADGVAFIFHDENLKRLAKKDKRFSECSSQEILDTDIGFGKRIPTLEQALLAFPRVQFNLDLKSEAAIEPTIAVIEKLQAHSNVLISSFSEQRRLKALSLLSKPVRSSAGTAKVIKLYFASLFGLKSSFKNLARGSSALQLPIKKGLIRFDSPSFISNCKNSNLEIHFWTINSPITMKKLAALGADGIVTDYCDLAITTLRSH